MNPFDHPGVPLDKQCLTWKEMAGRPISKLDDEAFTRIRVILMGALERDALRLGHAGGCPDAALRVPLAQVCRLEQHQATAVNWLLSADHSPLETTIAYEQAAIEITAAVAQRELDPYLAQVYRFGLVEDCDHLYRYSALLDRLEGKDANNILQGHTDIVPGRPAVDEHRAPQDDVRRPLAARARLPSRLYAVLIGALEHQAHDYYMTIGPGFADPVARQLYAEIASLEEQHLIQYGSLLDPRVGFLERWLVHEAAEVYGYYSCMEAEGNPRLRALWERFCDYEIGHLQHVGALLRRYEGRDPQEVLARSLPPPLEFNSQRDYVRDVLAEEVELRANGTEFVVREAESPATLDYRRRVNAAGSPSTQVAMSYRWTSGTELNRPLAPA